MKQAVFHRAGEIEQVHALADPDAPAPECPPGLSVCLFDEADRVGPSTHRVLGGVLVPYTEHQRACKAAPPLHPASWCNATMQWLDLRPPTAQADVARARLAHDIAQVEAGQARATREALLAICTALQINPGRLADIETTAASLRAQMPTKESTS
jgi:hypothetical protein